MSACRIPHAFIDSRLHKITDNLLATCATNYAISSVDNQTRSRLQRIARTPPTRRVFYQHSLLNERLNIARRGILRASCELCPLGRSKLTVNAIKRLIQHQSLSLVDQLIGVLFPELRFAQHGAKRDFRCGYRAIKTIKKPDEPRRHVKRGFLRFLKYVVIRFAFQKNLRRHAVKPLAAILRARQSQTAIARAIRPLPSSNG